MVCLFCSKDTDMLHWIVNILPEPWRQDAYVVVTRIGVFFVNLPRYWAWCKEKATAAWRAFK